MANLEQLDLIVNGDWESWNAWREANPTVAIDLSGANLTDTDLRSFNLNDANLNGATLYGSNLVGTNLVIG